MRNVEINGKTYPIEWNLYSQMLLEGLKPEYQEMIKTKEGNDGSRYPAHPTSCSAVMAWAALCGGSESFSKTPEWIIRQFGRDMKGMAALTNAVNEEIIEYQQFNALLAMPEGNAQAPTANGAKS